MKTFTQLNKLLLGLPLSILIGCGGEPKEPDNYGGTADSTAVTSLSDSTWFPHNQTPPPAEGKGSPFDTTVTTNKIFHQWSWQKFLWLTKPMESGKTLFEEQYTQVDAEMNVVDAVDGTSLVLTAVDQAGSNGILIANPDFGTDENGDTVYYTIHINEIFQDAANEALAFIRKDTVNLNNNATFPVSAVELKVSWVKLSSIPEDQQKSYYSTEAYITSTKEKTKVAFLGMHVVGVVENHPEFIWATFEHQDMAPKYDWSKSTATTDAQVTSDKDLLFFKKDAQATGADLFWSDSSAGPQNIFTVYEYGVPKIASDSFMVTSQNEPINYNNIVDINKCVAGQLKDVWNNYFYNGSVWIDTDELTPEQQADTINALGHNLADANKGKIAKGSVAAFNITLETFVQLDTTAVHAMNVDGLTSCISCHNSAPFTLTFDNVDYLNKRSPMYISHLFRGFLHDNGGADAKKIEENRNADFKLNRKGKRK